MENITGFGIDHIVEEKICAPYCEHYDENGRQCPDVEDLKPVCAIAHSAYLEDRKAQSEK